MGRPDRLPVLLLPMVALVLLEWPWRRRVVRLGCSGRSAGASVAVGLRHILMRDLWSVPGPAAALKMALGRPS